MTFNGSISIASVVAALALTGCDQGPGGAGASVPAPSNVIDAVPTEDDGERGSRPLPVARPVARPQTQAEPETGDADEAPENQTPTESLNTIPPKVTTPVAQPPIVIVPNPAPPAPTPDPAPEG